MDKLLIYLGESVVVLGIFYGAYLLVLRNGINHRLSRYYLLSSVVLALILPLHPVNFQFSGEKLMPEKTINAVATVKQDYKSVVTNITSDRILLYNQNKYSAASIGDQNAPTIKDKTPVAYNSLAILLLCIYLIGILTLLTRFAAQLIRIRKQINGSQIEEKEGIRFVNIAEGRPPYSFAKYLFISESLKNTQEFSSILEHEKAHIRQKHTFDVLFMELISALFWINPFLWLIRNSLRKVHEYLADEQVIRNGYNSIDYQLLLLERIIAPQTIALTSTFHFKPINQRLSMIKNLSKTVSARIRLLKGIPAITVIILSIAIGVIISCSGKEERAFQLVKIQGEGGYYNFSTSNIGYVLAVDSISSTTMLAQPGDLLAAFDDIIYHQDETSYSFSSNIEGVLLNNGKVFSIRFTDKPELQSWLQQLDTVDLSSLKNVVLSDKLPENYTSYLNLIAKMNPNIGLNIEKWNDEMPDVLKLFQPTWLAIIDAKMHQITRLTPLPELETLILSVSEVQINESLPKLPKLKKLVLTDMKPTTFLNNDFLINNPQIESIEFAECPLTNFTFLNELKHLKSLMVMNTDTVMDLQFIRNLESLTRLSILTNDGLDWEALTKCRKLKWLTLSGDISQSEFNSVIEANANLEVVEDIDCDSIISLEALTTLQHLKALVISDTLQDMATLLNLNKLEYLSVPENALQDSAYVAKLQASIPNAIIVPNDGFCMGSGWFIFFIPAIFGMTFLRKRLGGRNKRITS